MRFADGVISLPLLPLLIVLAIPILLPVLFILRSKRKKQLIATFRPAVEAAISQIRAIPPII